MIFLWLDIGIAIFKNYYNEELFWVLVFYSSTGLLFTGVVAQLVRAPACHAGGRGFDPRPFRLDKKHHNLVLFMLILKISDFFRFIF